MISITPPVTKPYAPATQSIAYVAILRQSQASPQGPRLVVQLTLLNAAQQPIPYDKGSIVPMSTDDLAAWVATPATAGDTDTQDMCRRTLPYLLKAFGLTGTVQ